MQLSLPPQAARRPLLKLVTLGGLVLLLLVPVAQLLGLVRERRSRQEEVRRELAGLWGGSQTVGALVLAVPYRAKVAVPATGQAAPAGSPPGVAGAAPQAGGGVSSSAATAGGGWTKTAPAVAVEEPPGWLFALPADVAWRGTLEPERRRRGLFEVVLFEAGLTATGWFRSPDPEALGIAAERVDWDGARALLLVGDVRGLQRRVALRWAGQEKAFEPGGGPLAGWPAAIQAPLGRAALGGERLPFTVELVLRGSESLQLLPLGESTRVELASTWPDPGFVGAPLPSERRIAGEGFSAVWDVPYFARNFPQQWRQPLAGGTPGAAGHSATVAAGARGVGDLVTAGEPGSLAGELAGSAFGVALVRPADPYQQTERAVKYAVLFILLTFTTVFLLELMSPVRLHPVHYLLVGFALCLFYLLLLALAEHLGIAVAYGLATAATVAVVGLYARSVLASRGRAAVVAAALVALYGWLFTVLRAEDYALLLGALGLFATLAAVMYLTRQLDWGTLRFREAPAGEG